ncbi:hypothetical protein E1B28_005993 [Marasmius oreades]|uniref:Wax synthase domain-containing protein n=1 Tax=Marasmius oreades TaxID=181124 RepID=A0A9P7S6S7_9AGAR|nr:uncharacterized protein E1B28_005993 [Marasmius oreades]KAG7095218.1 hypothetical protein E1B28_005993 [Marasmius oreades]
MDPPLPLLLSYFVFFSVYWLSLTQPKRSLSRQLSFLLQVCTAYPIFCSNLTTGNSVIDYTLGSFVFSFLLNAFAWSFLTDVPVPKRTSINPNTTESETRTYELSLEQAARLVISPRGIGWSHEPTLALPPRPNALVSRSHFILRQLGMALMNLLILDLVYACMWNVPCFHIGGPTIGDASYGLLGRCRNILLFAISAIASMTTAYHFISAFCLAIQISEPQNCPSFYGDFTKAYTLRGFWGRSWHQLLRPIIMPYIRFLAADIFHFPRGTKCYEVTMLYAGFLLTGVMHQVGDLMMHRNISAGGSIVFFPLQAFGITLESIVIGCLPKATPGWVRTAVGYVWVLSWFTWCAPIYVDPLLQGGLLDNGPRFSLTSGLLKGEWVPQPATYSTKIF